MAEFSAIVNREFEHAVANTTLLTIDDVTKEKKQEEAEGKAEEEQEKKTSPSGWRFRRAEDREEETGDETGKGTRSGDR